MPEPRPDMLPNVEDTSVIENVQSQVKGQQVIEDKPIEPSPEPTLVEPDVDKPPKGFVPYQALDEERRKRKELEQQLKQLEIKSSSPEIDDELLSDEGRFLKQQISALNEKISFLEQKSSKELVFNQYPVLKDKEEEFDEFKEDYPGVPLEKVAKLFITEKGLLESKVTRKGLEKPVGGSKATPQEGISATDVDRLMKGDERKFIKMVREGLINPDKIY